MKMKLTAIIAAALMMISISTLASEPVNERTWINDEIKTVREFKENAYELENITRDIEWAFSRIQSSIPDHKDNALSELERLYWTYRDMEDLRKSFIGLREELDFGSNVSEELRKIDFYTYERVTRNLDLALRGIKRNSDQLNTALRHDDMNRAKRAARMVQIDIRKVEDVNREYDWLVWNLDDNRSGDRSEILTKLDLDNEVFSLENDVRRIDSDIRIARIMMNNNPSSATFNIDNVSWKARDIDFAMWDFRRLHDKLSSGAVIDESLADVNEGSLYWAIQDVKDAVRNITSNCNTINSYIRMNQIDAASRYFWQLENASRTLDRAVSALRRL